jgi:hypothetical protein
VKPGCSSAYMSVSARQYAPVASCQWHTHMLQVQLSLLADSSIGVERGLDAVTKARGVHGRGKKVRRRMCALCSSPLEDSGSVRAVWVVGVRGYGGGLSCTLCFQHGRAGLMAWKIVEGNSTLVCLVDSAPLRLASGLWQARECVSPLFRKVGGS